MNEIHIPDTNTKLAQLMEVEKMSERLLVVYNEVCVK
jgi:hypothetical protein